MAECPHCEYNKKRAHNWRVEAYRLAGHPLPEPEWVGLTDDEMLECNMDGDIMIDRETAKRNVEAKLKEKNT
jgi:hypothetical protein